MQVHRQIEQMVMFIKQEAEEKANEIRMSAEEVRLAGASLLLGCLPTPMRKVGHKHAAGMTFTRRIPCRSSILRS